MSPAAIALAAGLAIGATGGWLAQGWRSSATLAEVQRQHAQMLAAQQTRALTEYRRMEETKDAAIRQAEQRAAQNRADADRAGAAADGLRKQLASVPTRITAATRTAVDEYAATAGELLGACVSEYRAVAAAADGHAADARLMIEAWPAQ